MSEKLDKLRASLEKERERRIKINNRIESLERRIQEAEAAEVNEMVRTAKVTPEQLAALLRQSATATPNPAALSAWRSHIVPYRNYFCKPFLHFFRLFLRFVYIIQFFAQFQGLF
ncbi:hypothetical protein FPR_16890 [Faecalibacterium prausnitzii SL3/3]|uniref:DUF4315 family protein n=1 Tax=Faecalibacterium prausnitzii SL3/3 TaxID=657322 RepID=D4KAT4_9FIRM|nr:DUF4315 family protein [Faecalibacterium prausnitzii]CBL01947.1 hypothetical protein FPR_16890 [Faecalibacterium prausnitzii SL3/3]